MEIPHPTFNTFKWTNGRTLILTDFNPQIIIKYINTSKLKCTLAFTWPYVWIGGFQDQKELLFQEVCIV